MTTSSPSCSTCEDFGWIPEVSDFRGWYQRNWRLLLDPTISWRRCPDCLHPQAAVASVHDYLARWLRARIISEATNWSEGGDWRGGDWQGSVVWRHENGLLLVGPGPANPHPWLLVSDHGVMQDLTIASCRYHLHEAGLALPPIAEG